MALKGLKTKKSKRLPCRQKYKILKKVREHNRKKNKLAKKSNHGKSKKQKLIQIPNICPFKDDILKDVEEFKKREKEVQIQRQEMLNVHNKSENLESLIEDANKREIVHTDKMAKENSLANEHFKKEKLTKEQSLKAYFKEFKKVIDAADVILEVVDARDPLGTRCSEVENAVKNSGGTKRLILILNKADLVPRENLEKWIKYFKKFGPVTAFKASTQDQTTKLGRRKFTQTKTNNDMQNSVCIGAELLMSMLGNYCRNNGIKTAIQVGVAGIPNVGKSSIINSLIRGKACPVGCTPGVTKSMQQVELDSKIKLIDCPGIVFSKNNYETNNNLSILLNAQRAGDIKDPCSVAEEILKRGTKEYFCKLYDVSEYDTYEEFFSKKALRMGKFLGRGIPNTDAAARGILNDWNSGKIKYCTQPPLDNLQETHLSASIINYDTKEFEFDNFDQQNQDLLHKFNLDKNDIIEMDTTLNPEDKKNVEKLHSMEISSDISDKQQPTKKRKFDETHRQKKQDPQLLIEGNQSINKGIKAQQKRQKKNKARTEKKVSNVSDVLEQFSL